MDDEVMTRVSVSSKMVRGERRWRNREGSSAPRGDEDGGGERSVGGGRMNVGRRRSSGYVRIAGEEEEMEVRRCVDEE